MIRRICLILRSTVPALAGALLCFGCKHEEIRAYTVVKPPPDLAPESAGDADAAPRPHPKLAYSVPPGWQDLGSSGMSAASFRIKVDGGEASVNVTPLGSMAGGESAIVNMWREQVGQPPLPDSEAAALLSPVDIGGESGQLFEINGQRGGEPLSIVTAFAHRPDGSWFFKLQGPEAVVAAQKPTFLEFLKSVRIEDNAGTASAPPSPQFHWKAPEGWQTLAPGQMQVAKFSVPDRGDAKAEVSVSIFPSESGGLLANVNRWRHQIGLAEVDEAGLKSCTSALEGVPNATLVDLSNENRSLLGAIVPRNGQWWFYKLLGSTAAVTPERENFIHFAQSQP